MSNLLWSFDQLVRFTRYEDTEVRYWAAERLVALFPKEAADPIADLLLDEHDATPDLVAEHLGRHGSSRHVPLLLRGFRNGSHTTPGRCLEALTRLGYEGTAALAAQAAHRRDLSDECLGVVVAALVGPDAARAGAEAADRARELLLRRPELYAEPAALRAAVWLFAPGDFADLMAKWITALHFKGLDRVEPCVRVLIEELQLEDCGWCVRTDRTGRIDLERTLRAIESGYDLEVKAAIPAEVRAELSERLARGSFTEIASALGGYVSSRCGEPDPGEPDSLVVRLDALGGAFRDPETAALAEGLEPAIHQWLIGLLVAACVKVSTYRNYLLEMEAARRDLKALLELAGLETSCLLKGLPTRLVAAAGAEGSAGRRRLEDWCLRTLEARGPFFPKSVALETLGRLESTELVPEIAAHLADDNPYIYGAAERALGRLGETVVEHGRAALAAGTMHPDVMHSLVKACCEQGRESSLRLMLDHFDEIFESLGPDAASELAALLAHPDLIPPMRRWLVRSPAMVGHTLLLLGALCNLPIPEEESILKAIDEYWKGNAEGPEGGGSSGPTGRYLM